MSSKDKNGNYTFVTQLLLLTTLFNLHQPPAKARTLHSHKPNPLTEKAYIRETNDRSKGEASPSHISHCATRNAFGEKQD